jgi:glycosyltransferase involved in cell wall biosynthesis
MNADQGRVLMANLSAPELTHLAAELACRGDLMRYVRRYANQNRWWERLLRQIPGAGPAYARTLGLRLPPEGLQRCQLVEAGVLQDFAAALLNRSALPRRLRSGLADRFNRGAFRAVGARASQLAEGARTVVAGAGTAYPLFRAVAGAGIPRVLNYPSAHHSFQRRFFRSVAEQQPEFSMLNESVDGPDSPATDAVLDAECKMADLILAGSTFARRSFIEEGLPPDRVVAIPYGVDVSRFTPGPRVRNDGRFRIVYVGRISQRKGIGYLLQAYDRFRRSDTDLQLVGNIVGDARCLAPHAASFTHTPHLPNHELVQVYRDADLFVFPSLLEGMGLVALEAMACGCPVVVTHNGPGDVVRDGIDGLVVRAGEVDALARAMERIYEDRDLRKSMAVAARQQAEQYAWSRYRKHAADAVLGARSAVRS